MRYVIVIESNKQDTQVYGVFKSKALAEKEAEKIQSMWDERDWYNNTINVTQVIEHRHYIKK